MEELRSADEATLLHPDSFFASIMYALSRFSAVRAPDSESEGAYSLIGTLTERYRGDSALFEVGCYLCFLLDFWLFHVNREERDCFCDWFNERFDRLFAEAFHVQTEAVSELAQSRMSFYGSLTKKAVTTEELLKKTHKTVMRAIVRAEANEMPEHYDFEQLPVLGGDATVRYLLEAKLMAFEAGMLPAIYRTVLQYLEKVRQILDQMANDEA